MNTDILKNKPKLLIVEDDETIRSQIRWAFFNDYDVSEAMDRTTALKTIDIEHPLVVMLDLGLPPTPREATEGLIILHEILERDHSIKVIVVTGNMEKKNALKAVELGAYDFFTKPPAMEEVRFAVKRAFCVAQLERENSSLYNEIEINGLEGMLGDSLSMQNVFQSIQKVATVDVSVLIIGESGTGKELAAKAIHRFSTRRDGPFIAINCGAIPENLLESELFGYEKGAFTGANVRRKGRVEYADGGILFLDEIGELSLALQVKLLRFLQEHVIERIGGRESISVDVRVIAATNQDLSKRIEAGQFREDLFYRLGVVTISIPPLREREDDIFLLSRAFLHRYSMEFKKRVRTFTDDAIKNLKEYSWPGNVRELQNRIKRAIVMTEGDCISSRDMEFADTDTIDIPVPSSRTLREMRESLEKQIIQQTLLKHGNMIYKAAKELNITRQTLSYLLKKYGILVK